MILSDFQIKRAINQGSIVIEPFDEQSLGPNSYDVHLGSVIKTMWPRRPRWDEPEALDAAVEGCNADIVRHKVGPQGFIMCPGRLYLASTVEYTETAKHVPFLDGKSSIGRLGIVIHCTAGRGDIGFKGHWTMEIFVIQPVRVYAGMPIGQLIYFEADQSVMPYDQRPSSKYNNRDPEPQVSQMWRNFKESR